MKHASFSFRPCLALLLVPVLGLMLAACSGNGDDDLYVEKPVDELYHRASDLLKNKEYKEAAEEFAEVERQHPYSQWATRAQIMSAYAQYEALEYDDAINTLDRFIQLHPGNPQIDYAYYLRAMCYYERIPDTRRDQSFTREAEAALRDVVNRFPNTAYARNAKVKLSLVQDQLAGAEMEIGRWYLRRQLYTAAIGRFQEVVTHFNTTSHIPEALHRLVECYLALGMKREAQATAAVLGHNFPGSSWYQDSYHLLTGQGLAPADQEGSWISGVWRDIF